jgi:hypothetical protein
MSRSTTATRRWRTVLTYALVAGLNRPCSPRRPWPAGPACARPSCPSPSTTGHATGTSAPVRAARRTACGTFTHQQRPGLRAGHVTDRPGRWPRPATRSVGGHPRRAADVPGRPAPEICNDRVALLNMGFSVKNLPTRTARRTPPPTGRRRVRLQQCPHGGRGGLRLTAARTPSRCRPSTPTSPRPRLGADHHHAGQDAGYVTQAEQHGGGWVRSCCYVCDVRR